MKKAIENEVHLIVLSLFVEELIIKVPVLTILGIGLGPVTQIIVIYLLLKGILKFSRFVYDIAIKKLASDLKKHM